MKLSQVFSAVAHKQIVAVDLPHAGSNQHELNGVGALRGHFGVRGRKHDKISWHYFADDREPEWEENEFTFYGARARSAVRTGRSEWRFYYYGNFLSHAAVGDLLVLARAVDGRHFGMIFQDDSVWHRAAKALLGLGDVQREFDTLSRNALDGKQLAFLGQQILAELDLSLSLPVERDDEALVCEKFGSRFPTTREMSAFARLNVETDSRRAFMPRTRMAS